MFRLLSIQLIFVVLLGSAVDLHDLAKLPYLIDHFNQHKLKDTQFSFSEFFDMHYGNQAEEHDKEEKEKHKGLPFKAPEHTSIHSPVFITEYESPSIELESTEVAYTNFYQSNSSSEYHPSIFQPPRKG